jgi:hypothetical protein
VSRGSQLSTLCLAFVSGGTFWDIAALNYSSDCSSVIAWPGDELDDVRILKLYLEIVVLLHVSSCDSPLTPKDH